MSAPLLSLSTPVYPTQEILDLLKSLDPSFNDINLTDIKAPTECWEWLIQDLGKLRHLQNVNGCGTHMLEAIPNSILGLRITAICNVHDAMYHLCKTRADCNLSNITMIVNMLKYINRQSNALMVWPRRYIALTYYSFVDSSKHLFCKGYKNNE